MNKSIVLISNNDSFYFAFRKYFSHSRKYNVLPLCASMQGLREIDKYYNIDIIIFHVEACDNSYFSQLSELRDEMGTQYKLIIVSVTLTKGLADSLFILDVDGFEFTNTTMEDFEMRIDALYCERPYLLKPVCFDNVYNVSAHVTSILIKIGVPVSIKGFNYLRFAIMEYLGENKPKYITKHLYPKMARIYETSASNIERSIRHAIELAFERGDYEVLVKYFGNTITDNKAKPTNSEFISLIAERIRMSNNFQNKH